MSPSSRTIVLQSNDGETKTFEVEQSIVQLSQLIKRTIEEDSTKTVITVPAVSGDILSSVIDYCRNHVKPADDNDSFDRKFVDVDEATLLDLISAAAFLEINSLLDLTCQALADKIKYKTVEEVREIFNIENDYTSEEEEELNGSAF